MVMDLTELNLSAKPVAERLGVINQVLAANNLRQFPSIGDNKLGESEIVDIIEWPTPHTKQWQDIVFLVRRVDGTQYRHQIRFNSNGAVCDGVIFIPVINGRVALVKQFRVALGQWTVELPRGFAENPADIVSAGVNSLPPALLRELDEEVMKDAQVSSFDYLGLVADNTGTHNVMCQAYVVRIKADPLRGPVIGTQGLGVVFVDWEALLSKPASLGVRDAHSLAVIALAREGSS
jgi:hypothetical protein